MSAAEKSVNSEEQPQPTVAEKENEGGADGRKKELLNEIEQLVAELRTAVPEAGVDAYSPLLFLSAIKQKLNQFAPDVQLGILESFEGMTREDAMDIETWKGMAYMLSYSARFQAAQVKDKINETLPTPLQPDTTINFMRQTIERFTPEIAQNILETFQGATREDLLDVDTWRGIWTMLSYSLQFQMNAVKDKIMENGEEEYLD